MCVCVSAASIWNVTCVRYALIISDELITRFVFSTIRYADVTYDIDAVGQVTEAQYGHLAFQPSTHFVPCYDVVAILPITT